MQPSHSRSKFSSCEYVFSIHLTSVQSQIEVQQIVHVKQHVAFTHFATNKCECCVRKNNNGPSARQLSRTRCAIVSPFLSISEWPRWNGKYLFFSIFPLHSFSLSLSLRRRVVNGYYPCALTTHNTSIYLQINLHDWVALFVSFIHSSVRMKNCVNKNLRPEKWIQIHTHTGIWIARN